MKNNAAGIFGADFRDFSGTDSLYFNPGAVFGRVILGVSAVNGSFSSIFDPFLSCSLFSRFNITVFRRFVTSSKSTFESIPFSKAKNHFYIVITAGFFLNP